MNAIRQIADGMRFQERMPLNGWVPSEHVPIADLLVRMEMDGDSQYAMMVKVDLYERAAL